MLACAQIAYNVLRLLGERMRHSRPGPPKRQREPNRIRLRPRTVMQVMLHHAGVLVAHACGTLVKLGRWTAHGPWVMAVLQACPGGIAAFRYSAQIPSCRLPYGGMALPAIRYTARR